MNSVSELAHDALIARGQDGTYINNVAWARPLALPEIRAIWLQSPILDPVAER